MATMSQVSTTKMSSQNLNIMYGGSSGFSVFHENETTPVV
jgi:hypothetical protein